MGTNAMARTILAATAAIVLATAGCNLPPASLGHPGPAAGQRARAVQFDPWVSRGREVTINDDGLRPREFDIPPAESYQGRWIIRGDSWWDRHGF